MSARCCVVVELRNPGSPCDHFWEGMASLNIHAAATSTVLVKDQSNTHHCAQCLAADTPAFLHPTAYYIMARTHHLSIFVVLGKHYMLQYTLHVHDIRPHLSTHIPPQHMGAVKAMQQGLLCVSLAGPPASACPTGPLPPPLRIVCTHCSMFALLLKLYPAQQAMTILVANMHMLTMRTYRADSV